MICVSVSLFAVRLVHLFTFHTIETRSGSTLVVVCTHCQYSWSKGEQLYWCLRADRCKQHSSTHRGDWVGGECRNRHGAAHPFSGLWPLAIAADVLQ